MNEGRAMKVEEASLDNYDVVCEDLDSINRNLTSHIESIHKLADRLFGVISSSPPIPKSEVEEVLESDGIMGQISDHIKNTHALLEEAKMAFSRLDR